MASSTERAAACTPSRRLTSLPTYVFAWLDELKAAARERGGKLIDLGIGNPDRPTPKIVTDAIAKAYADPTTHGYPPFKGTPRFRRAVADFMRARFGADVDPETEVLALSGAKEGIAQLTIGLVCDDDVSIVPDIYYPVHARATGLTGGTVYPLPLRRERGFLPNLRDIPEDVLRRARMLIVNYPHNPTGAVAPLEFFAEAVALCARHGIALVSDLAYSELTFDDFVAPSVFQVPGAKDVAIEFHSFSKSFNMAGSRIGFAVGGNELIDVLYAVRTNMGYGTPAAIQEGAVVALENARELVPPVVAGYQERRDALIEGFRSLGWPAEAPRATMFVWLPVPEGFTSQEWTQHLIDKAGVVVTPGNAFGPGGEGFFRVSLVGEPTVLRDAIARMKKAGIRFGARS
jgi:LL-diaminopimelate aminotransferase